MEKRELPPKTAHFEIRHSLWRMFTNRPAWYVWDNINQCMHPSTVNKINEHLRYYETEWGAASYCNTMNKLANAGGI